MDWLERYCGPTRSPSKTGTAILQLVESGGAICPQKEIFIPGGRMFRDLTRLSAAGIPDFDAPPRKAVPTSPACPITW